MTPHIEAPPRSYAGVVIAPGDPIRAKLIAETLLEDFQIVNSVRNCLGYTGFYKNKLISIQATGMGQPSLGIYVTELYKMYHVDSIIRLGTCGSFFDDINVGDLVISLSSGTDSNIISNQINNLSLSPCCSVDLLRKFINNDAKSKSKIWYGQTFSSDLFYQDDSNWWHRLKKQNVLAVDMETSYLYFLANKFERQAITVNMVSNNLRKNVFWSANEKESKTLETAEFIMDLI